jgi:RNA polymerase sigma-B factor
MATSGVLDRGIGNASARGGADHSECACGFSGCRTDFTVLASAGPGPRAAAVRDRIIERHLEMSRNVAARYRRTGVALDDLAQVAALAMIEAADRFDPARGVPFSAFAAVTISGTIKRYFRDNGWVMQTPRRLKELSLEVRGAVEELTQWCGHQPTVSDIAVRIGREEHEVLEALCAEKGRRPLSIDAPAAGAATDGTTLGGLLGNPDDSYDMVEYAESLRPLLADLPPRELRVITLRFYGNMTQSEIAHELGCSQMQVSRLLRTALSRLRQGLEDDRTERSGPDRSATHPGAASALPAGERPAPSRAAEASGREEPTGETGPRRRRRSATCGARPRPAACGTGPRAAVPMPRPGHAVPGGSRPGRRRSPIGTSSAAFGRSAAPGPVLARARTVSARITRTCRPVRGP